MQTIELNIKDVKNDGYQQTIMNVAFAKWNDHNNPINDKIAILAEDYDKNVDEISKLNHETWNLKDWFETLSDIEKFAVASGTFNYQVENGGFQQWIFNGYPQVTLPVFIDFLDVLPMNEPSVKYVFDFIMRLKYESEKTNWSNDDYHIEDVEEKCDECDGTGYIDGEECEYCINGILEDEITGNHMDDLMENVDIDNDFNDKYGEMRFDFLKICGEFFEKQYIRNN